MFYLDLIGVQTLHTAFPVLNALSEKGKMILSQGKGRSLFLYVTLVPLPEFFPLWPVLIFRLALGQFSKSRHVA